MESKRFHISMSHYLSIKPERSTFLYTRIDFDNYMTHINNIFKDHGRIVRDGDDVDIFTDDTQKMLQAAMDKIIRDYNDSYDCEIVFLFREILFSDAWLDIDDSILIGSILSDYAVQCIHPHPNKSYKRLTVAATDTTREDLLFITTKYFEKIIQYSTNKKGMFKHIMHMVNDLMFGKKPMHTYPGMPGQIHAIARSGLVTQNELKSYELMSKI